MSEWQKKLAEICDDLGVVGEIYFRDISDAVLAEIDAAYERDKAEHPPGGCNGCICGD